MSTVAAAEAHAAFALAEALDVPRKELVRFGTENAFLRHLARVEGAEAAWDEAVRWMGQGTPAERLSALRREYYGLFLHPGRELAVYLHEWYPGAPPPEFLRDWSALLESIGLEKSPPWRNGPDHLSVVFEVYGHLRWTSHPQRAHFERAYLEPWLAKLATGLDRRAASGVYRAAAALAGGLSDEIRRRRR